jgi:hypothetical protein
MDQISSTTAPSGAAEVLMMRRTLTQIQNKAAALLRDLPSPAEATSAPVRKGLYL